MFRCRRRSRRSLPLAAALALLACPEAASICVQEERAGPPADPEPQDPAGPQDLHPYEGLEVKEIRVEGATTPDDAIRRLMKTKVGHPLRSADVADDLQTLWRRLKVVVLAAVAERVEGGVRLRLTVEESSSFDRYEFHGLERFTEREVRSLLGIDALDRLTRRAAEQYAATLRDRYRSEGHAYVRVRIEEDLDRSILHFWVDEGPRVTIRSIQMIGNDSFPGWAPIRFFDNIIDSAGLQSTPGLFGGQPYSETKVEEDLERLRFFYRRQGYRDAQVELAGVVPVEDYTAVDLTIRIEEGPRYRIGSVDLEQIPPPGRDTPLYAREEVMREIQVEAGEFYDWNRIRGDETRIARYYGERGHPQRGEFGRGLENAFEVLERIERFVPGEPVVHLTYVVSEGTPKRLRDVVIRGNTYTRDFVIRRNIFVMPGEILDMPEVERSLGALDALRYFQDPNDFGGVRFELDPVPQDPDVVDLRVDVQEGDTGEILWGAGVSTHGGVQGRAVITKRNFDISRLPSSLNPIDWLSEITHSRAFHGAGQSLQLLLAPGTELSMFELEFEDPDVFRRHFDTIGLRVQGYRRLQFFDSFDMDSLGVSFGLQRAFTEKFAVGFSVRQETVEVDMIDANAPSIVFDAEGSTEMRGLRLNTFWNDVDYPLRPTTGHRFHLYGEVVGGPFGGDEDLWKVGTNLEYFLPLYRDSLDRAHVLRFRHGFDWGEGFADSDVLFLTERFYMGGSNLRGFDRRRAGPSQFGKPLGGEVLLLSGVEYQFPLVSTRQAGRFRPTEVLRGVLFVDAGMLGLGIDDLGEPRLSAGIGLRIHVPVLNLPIALDLGWPILSENTDEQRQFSFSLARF